MNAKPDRKRYRKTTAEQQAERDAADRAMRALLRKLWLAYIGAGVALVAGVAIGWAVF